MNLELINSIACGFIALWAAWCVLSGKVRDGILGKLIYSTIAISGFVVGAQPEHLLRPDQCRPDTACVTGPGRRPPHFHGHLLAAGEGLAVPDTELRALPAL